MLISTVPTDCRTMPADLDEESLAPHSIGLNGAAVPHSSLTMLQRYFWSSTAISLFDQAIVSGGNFLTTVLIARTAGLAELGVYSLGFTVMVLLAAVQESLIVLPYTVLGIRLTGASRARSAGSAMAHQVALTAVAIAGLLTFSGWQWLTARPLVASPVLSAFTAAVPFILLREFARRMAFADLHASRALVLDVCVVGCQLTIFGSAAALGTLDARIGIISLGIACALGSVFWLLWGRSPLHVDWTSVRQDLRRNWPVGKWACLSRITSVAEGYAMHWLLAGFISTSETGAFAACMTIIALANPFLLGIGSVAVPNAAQAYARGGKQELRQVLRILDQLVLIPTVGFALVLWFFGGEFLRALYGSTFAAYQSTIGVLGLSLVVGIASFGADNGLRVLGRTRQNFLASMFGLITSLSCGYFLVPYGGVAGAAWALLAGTTVTSVFRRLGFLRAIQSTNGEMA